MTAAPKTPPPPPRPGLADGVPLAEFHAGGLQPATEIRYKLDDPPAKRHVTSSLAEALDRRDEEQAKLARARVDRIKTAVQQLGLREHALRLAMEWHLTDDVPGSVVAATAAHFLRLLETGEGPSFAVEKPEQASDDQAERGTA